MSIIRKGVDKIGSFSIKKKYTIVLDSGTEECIAALVIPQWCHLGYGSIRFEATGASPIDPWKTGECAIRGSIAHIDEAVELGANNWQAKMEQHVPIDPDQIESDTADAIDVGVTGGQALIDAAKGHQFFRREYTMSLARGTAYPTNANAIRFKVAGRYEGHFRTGSMLDISKPKMLFVGGLASKASMETSNEHVSSSGGYSSPEVLYNDLMAHVPFPVGVEGAPGSTSDDLSSQLKNYLHEGYERDDLSVSDGDNNLNVQMWLSARLDVYAPASASYVRAP